MLRPTKRKADWLDATTRAFSQAVQLGLDAAHDEHTSSRAKLHRIVYRQARERFGLPADYARMAVNAALSLARSHYGQRRSRHFRRASFPKINGSQGIGLGVNAYKLIKPSNRFVLRVSTGKRGKYVWLPLCVPSKYHDRLLLARGDAKLFKRGDDWYVMLPIHVSPTPTVCDGEDTTFIGIDLGIVRLASIATPNGVVHFDGKAARRKREHFANLRRRYQRHQRTDRVKTSRGKERCWMRDLNHKLSTQIVDIALRYPHPVIVLERLDGIRNRLKASKRFNRMMASWAFRQLVSFVEYKAARYEIPVVFVDPRRTSCTCPRCGHSTRSNRVGQSNFRCVVCNYRGNADAVAAINIARRGFEALGEGRPDTARLLQESQTGDYGSWPDGVKVCNSLHTDSNLASPS
ncbi:MAG: RNA-guided endonuclease InsQ/TnpB family protein [Anaerolineae bacterium]